MKLFYIFRENPLRASLQKLTLKLYFLARRRRRVKPRKFILKINSISRVATRLKTANQDRIETAQQINFQPRVAAVGAGGNRVRMTNVLPRKSCIKERFIELTANVVLIVMTPEVFLCLSWFTEELRKSTADDGDDVEQF